MNGLRWRRLIPVGAASVTFLAFLPVLQAGFVNWDDPANFLENLNFRGFGWAQLKWMFTTSLMGHYIPLTWLTLAANYALGGMDPWGYHLGNLLLHAGNTLLFCLVAKRLLEAAFVSPTAGAADWIAPTLGAAVAAVAFGVHPLRVETVAWVTERRSVLAGGFYLLAILAYLRGVREGGALRRRWRWASLAAFVAALLSKGIVVTLPATLLILDVYPLRRLGLGWRQLVREKIPYLAVAAAGGLVVLAAQARGVGLRGYDDYGPPARLAMVGYSLWFYPWKMLWPEGLSPLYELPIRVDPLAWRFLGPLLGVIIVSLVLWLARRRFPGGLAAWLSSLVALAPVSGVVHAGYHLAHDRYSYLSGLGFALLGGAGVSWTLRQWQRRRLPGWLVILVIVGAGLALLGWGTGTWRQSHVWRSSETLWRAAVEADPECALCRNSLAVGILETAADDGRLREAEAHLRRSILLSPRYPPPHYNLGFLLARDRRYAEAELRFKEFIRLEPQSATGPGRLGMLYVDQGRYQEAVPLLQLALRLDPGFALARTDLARARRSVEIEPGPGSTARDGASR